MMKLGVIGHPVEHSKSPLIHRYWIEKQGMKGSYEIIEIVPNQLKERVNSLIENGYAGFNVTIPHKQAIIDLCDDIDDTAQAIGAVNTIVVEEGKLSGFNTDAFGFVENVKAEQPDFDFRTGPAVVLGAGGAARAVVYGLLKQGAPEIVLTNRTKEKAENLQADFGDRIKVVDWNEKEQYLANANLLVNTTSLGMERQAPLEINLKSLSQQAVVVDIVYVPLMTELLKMAQSRGNPIVTGIGMLLHQARPAFEKWFGVMPEVTDELRELVLK